MKLLRNLSLFAMILICGNVWAAKTTCMMFLKNGSKIKCSVLVITKDSAIMEGSDGSLFKHSFDEIEKIKSLDVIKEEEKEAKLAENAKKKELAEQAKADQQLSATTSSGSTPVASSEKSPSTTPVTPSQPQQTEVVGYAQVLNSAFAEDYQDKSVVIEAVYLQSGFWKGYHIPKFIKKSKYYVFQCVQPETGSSVNATNKPTSGEIFVIDKSLSSEVINLKPGEKVKFKGHTKVENSSSGGGQMEIYFVVEEVVK
ncbi:MAG TPA: hypothetical protein PK588_00025 [Paludibacteraceae bacterium]|jgi:hypothetical protein|nr:hypothetical protein [Paludibacteraceae bacterium]